MFEIEYRGGNTVVITTKKSTIVTDPKTSLVGLKDVAIKEAIEIATEERFATNGPDAKLLIDGPGEYGVSDFDIKGLPVQRHLDAEGQPLLGTMYRIEVGDVRIGLLGNVYEKLHEDQLEELGVLDILIVPVGGNGYTLDATGAANIVRRIDPKIVIPVHYEDKALNYEVPQAPLSEFISEINASVETVSKFKLKGASALPASLTVIELTRS